jgi:hypothetical protein
MLVEEVMSEGHALQLFDQLVYDKVVPRDSVPVVDNTVSYHIDSDGCVVMDSTIVTVLLIREVNHEDKTNKERKAPNSKYSSSRSNSVVGNPYIGCWFPY